MYLLILAKRNTKGYTEHKFLKNSYQWCRESEGDKGRMRDKVLTLKT